ncbi:Uncharacterised protein [uncultured archaeon]|nr:Uncharacterised protein [uncultured archaeon]
MKTLAKIIGAGLIITAAGTALVKSLVDGYYDSQPHITYLVNGKEVITRTFDSNEALKAYEESEPGKKEAEYYLSLNNRRAK